MVSIAKSVYLITFIFAVNLFSVNCVYKRDCEKDCTEEEKWPENIKKKFVYNTPLTNIDYSDAEVKDLDSAVKAFFNCSSILKCENNPYEVTCYPGTAQDAGTITGGVLGDEIYTIYEFKIHTASHPGKSAGGSLGDPNDFDGPAILVELVYVKSGTTVTNALKQRDGFVQFFIGIEVVGVIDNDLASCLVAALKKIKKKPEGPSYISSTHITVCTIADIFFDEIVIASSYITTVGHIFIDDGVTQTYADASIVIYLARKACSWVSYQQWIDGFSVFEDKYGNPRSLEQKFYEPFDCQPIVQAPGITACKS